MSADIPDHVAGLHPGFSTARRISGFTVDCDGCSWRGFTYIIAECEALHAKHVADEAERIALVRPGYASE